MRIRSARLQAVVISVTLAASLPMSAYGDQAGVPPGPPTSVTAAAGDGVVYLSWLAPADTGSGPIIDYWFSASVYGVVVLQKDLFSTATVAILGYDDFAINDISVVYSVYAATEFGYTESAPAAEVTPRAGAPTPSVVIESVSPAGGSATSDGGGGPTPSDPVATTVNAPATAGGGTITIAETTPSEAPAGFVFLGQEIVIESTLATDASNPLRITFSVDPSFVPVTIFRDGLPIETACAQGGTANPSPCVESGAGTASITILSDHASRWNVGFAAYGFDGFFSPVDNRPVTNSTKAGSGIPVRFGLGGARGLNVFVPGYPRSQQVTCDSGSAIDGIEETTRTDAVPLTYSAGTGLYQYTWKTERSWAGTCRELIARFRDGTEQRALFKFK